MSQLYTARGVHQRHMIYHDKSVLSSTGVLTLLARPTCIMIIQSLLHTCTCTFVCGIRAVLQIVSFTDYLQLFSKSLISEGVMEGEGEGERECLLHKSEHDYSCTLNVA